jgi:hypothetical protein
MKLGKLIKTTLVATTITISAVTADTYSTYGNQTYGSDGTTWSTTAFLATGRATANGLGTPSSTSAALVSAGEPSRKATEEFTGETVAVNAAKTIDFD